VIAEMAGNSPNGFRLGHHILRTFWRLRPVGKPVSGVGESRVAFADPGGEIGGLI